MAKPKLCLIPATIGDKVYSILPSNGVGDFDFTRATTATRINAQGLIEEVASGENRLNYSLLDGKVVGCPHLLLENSATNLIQYSEDFSNAYWIKATVSLASNQIISPDGTLNADKITESSTNGLQQIYSDVITTTPSSDYVYSIFIKKEERNWVKVMTAINNGANFNVEDGVIGIVDSGITANIENYGNGWFKCSVSFNTSASLDRVYVRISTSNGVTSYQGDGTSGVYIYGAMLEQGSYPTSYIKSNSGSATTRAAETCTGSGDAATFNDSEGVLMAEISALDNDGTYRLISISDGNVNNSTNIQYSGVSNQIRARIETAGLPQADITSTVTSQTLFHKIAVLYKSNQFELWSNGFKVGEDTNGTPPSGINKLSFDRGDGGNDFYGKTKQIQYFDSALTDSELETLTSWDSFRDMAEGQLYTIE